VFHSRTVDSNNLKVENNRIVVNKDVLPSNDNVLSKRNEIEIEPKKEKTILHSFGPYTYLG
jgi:hypothetical protein